MTREEFMKEFASTGGHARAAALSPERRKQIAKLAAAARWGKKKRKAKRAVKS